MITRNRLAQGQGSGCQNRARDEQGKLFVGFDDKAHKAYDDSPSLERVYDLVNNCGMEITGGSI